MPGKKGKKKNPKNPGEKHPPRGQTDVQEDIRKNKNHSRLKNHPWK